MFAFFNRRRPAPPLERLSPPPPELHYYASLADLLAPRYLLKRQLRNDSIAHELLADTADGRQVVVHCLPPNWSDPELHRRMRRELEILTRLEHPGIVRVLEFDCRDEWFWWIRPWINARRLRKCLNEGPIAVAQAVVWLIQIHEALEWGHRLGVVHRDLTPEAIWVDETRIWLTNFGSLPRFDHRVNYSCAEPLGSPHYMPPEVITGASPTPANDYYALGAIAYHMLSGRPVFEADDVMAVLMKIMTEPPPRLDGELPPALIEMVDGLLAKDPGKRLSNADTVRALLSDRRPAATPVSEEMSEFLGQMQQEARCVTSDSEFTLDAARALEKLQAFQFTEGHVFVLALVAAGQALDCTRLEVTGTTRKLTLSYHQCKLTRPQLENLWSYAFSRDHRGLSHLSLGLAGALRQPKSSFTLTSGEWTFTCKQLEQPRLQRTILRHDLSLTIEAEFAALEGQFRYAPIPVIWNGKPVPPRPQPNRPDLDGFGFHFAPGDRPEWTAVVDGMAFPLPARDEPSGRVIVWGPLQIDLSYRRLVQDKSHSALLEQLHQAVDQAICDLALDADVNLPEDHYRYALGLWQKQSRSDLVLALDRKILRQAQSSRLLKECVHRLQSLSDPPLEYWVLFTHRQFLPPEWNWKSIQQVAARAFTDSQAALQWQLAVWLDWRTHQPDLEQIETLLHEIRRLRLPPTEYEQALCARLPGDLSDELRERWHDLFPRDWLDCRAALK